MGGSRTFSDRAAVADKISQLRRNVVVLTSRTYGASAAVRDAVQDQRLQMQVWTARMEKFRTKDAAYFARDEEMIRSADHVIEFWDGEIIGTSHELDYARKLGKPVELVLVEGQHVSRHGPRRLARNGSQRGPRCMTGRWEQMGAETGQAGRNPYRPGMGLEPPYLADRQYQLLRFTRYLDGFPTFRATFALLGYGALARPFSFSATPRLPRTRNGSWSGATPHRPRRTSSPSALRWSRTAARRSSEVLVAPRRDTHRSCYATALDLLGGISVSLAGVSISLKTPASQSHRRPVLRTSCLPHSTQPASVPARLGVVEFCCRTTKRTCCAILPWQADIHSARFSRPSLAPNASACQ